MKRRMQLYQKYLKTMLDMYKEMLKTEKEDSLSYPAQKAINAKIDVLTNVLEYFEELMMIESEGE